VDTGMARQLLGSDETIEALRAKFLRPQPLDFSLSADLPLSHESKRVLAYAAEESQRLAHQHIGTEHLLLGLLREQDGRAAGLLHEFGVDLSRVRELIAKTHPTTKEELFRLIEELPQDRWPTAAYALQMLKRGATITAREFVTHPAAPGAQVAPREGTKGGGPMFGLYTEHARRTIFFARYEASTFGSPSIESEHLLLGLLREHKALVDRLLDRSSAEQIREEIEQRKPPGKHISTSVDLPLSLECKRALAFGADEAQRLQHQDIGTGHLLVGLLREEKSLGAELLRAHGVDLEKARKDLGGESTGR